MNTIDILYQNAVEKETERLLKLSVDDVLKIDNYGSIEKDIDGKKIMIGFWHYKFNDNLHHIFFQAERKVFLFLHKKYLSGIKIEEGKVSKLNSREIGDYD